MHKIMTLAATLAAMILFGSLLSLVLRHGADYYRETPTPHASGLEATR